MATGRTGSRSCVPNQYVELPIDEDLDLARPVIVKIHGGAVHDAPPSSSSRHNFVVTEDDYIGYLSQSPVESLDPDAAPRTS